jgi:hypothetical protein
MNVGWVHLQSIDHVDFCFELIFVLPRNTYTSISTRMTSLQRNPIACSGRLTTRLLHEWKDTCIDVSSSAFAAPLAI